MPKSLAEGHVRFALLTAKPANPAAPTVAELNAGIMTTASVSCNILSSDFNFGPTGSDKISEPALCDQGKTEALGLSSYVAEFTAFRYFDATTKNAHATEDALFQALKVKGATLYAYARETAKISTDAFAAGDELYFGAEVVNDSPARGDGTGYIKRRVVCVVSKGYENIAVA